MPLLQAMAQPGCRQRNDFHRDLVRHCPGPGSATRPQLEWAVADDGGTVHDSPLRQIVRNRIVLGDSIVPKRDIIHAPAPAYRELGPSGLRKQEGQQRIALAAPKFVDLGGKAVVDEQALASGYGMRP